MFIKALNSIEALNYFVLSLHLTDDGPGKGPLPQLQNCKSVAAGPCVCVCVCVCERERERERE